MPALQLETVATLVPVATPERRSAPGIPTAVICDLRGRVALFVSGAIANFATSRVTGDPGADRLSSFDTEKAA